MLEAWLIRYEANVTNHVLLGSICACMIPFLFLGIYGLIGSPKEDFAEELYSKLNAEDEKY